MQLRAVYYTVKCISLHSALADGRRSNMEKMEKMEKLKKKKKLPKKRRRKKCYPLSFPILGGRNSTRALQSSSFQNPGSYPEREVRRTNKRRKSSCLILNKADGVALLP